MALDRRLLVPYSVSTGVPEGGRREIDGYVTSLQLQGVSQAAPCCSGPPLPMALTPPAPAAC